MRSLTVTALFGALTTAVAGAALKAPDAVTATLAVAAVIALTSWLSALGSTDDEATLGWANPVGQLVLTLAHRAPGGQLLPAVAAHVVGAIVAGFGVAHLVDDAGTLVWSEPTVVAASVLGLIVGVITSWVTLIVDGGEHAAWSLAPTAIAAATLGTGLIAAAVPGTLLGLAVAGLLSWQTAGVTAAAVVVGAVVGAYTLSLVTPSED